MDHQFHDPKLQHNIPKPMFDVIEPSIVRAQFIAKKDVSFSAYIHQSQHHQNKLTTQKTARNGTQDSDQISIFDAAKYFSGLDDDQKEHNSKGVVNNLAPIPPRLSSVSSDDNGSNLGGQSSHCTSNNYRARSFHATPTASSEASWNSQTGLLANTPGSFSVTIPKNLSPNNNNNTSTTTSNVTPRWPRISTKWLMPRQKCPCSGKKSVQVEERIDSTTPRMVDLRRSTSTNGSATNYITSSWYSPRKNSPKNFGTTTMPLTSLTPNVVTPREPRNNNSNFNLNSKSHHHHPNSKVKSITNHSDMIGTTTNVVATVGGKTTTSTNGFTFPILENPPVGVKKMFNVIAEPPRESLEVFQPRSHSSPKSRRMSYEDENVLSDGSSDLFEIESFSTTTYPCRDSMDEEVMVHASSFNTSTMKRLGILCRSNNNNNNNMNVDDNDGMDEEPMTPSVAPTECYAPSEVSVDWSVTTAEGFDRGSISNFSASASEVGMYAAMRRESERNNGCGGGGGGGEDRKSKQGGGKGNNNGGGLLSCRCEKAVSVGPGPIKCSAQGGPLSAARHVNGRATQQPHGVTAHVNGRWK